MQSTAIVRHNRSNMVECLYTVRHHINAFEGALGLPPRESISPCTVGSQFTAILCPVSSTDAQVPETSIQHTIFEVLNRALTRKQLQ